MLAVVEKFFQSSELGHSRAYLNCFPYLGGYNPFLPDVQCVENNCVIYFPKFLDFSGKRINQDPAISYHPIACQLFLSEALSVASVTPGDGYGSLSFTHPLVIKWE